MASKMEWTLMFTGGIFDYFLPNLRFFEQITTFGDVHCTFPAHALADIAAVSALTIADSRTVNKAERRRSDDHRDQPFDRRRTARAVASSRTARVLPASLWVLRWAPLGTRR
jgi:hypothetical protein